jgi:hypothetical protein
MQFGECAMRMKNEGKTCALSGCDLKARKKGYCETHYQRFRIHGDASITKRAGNSVLKDWIAAHVSHDGDGCLTWPFTRDNNGYPQITIAGRNKKATRVMCEAIHGPAPTEKHHAAHLCGKGHEGCIHPKHLAWKTRKENEADKLIHGTRPRGEIHPGAKLTKVSVEEIRRRCAAGELLKNIAKDFRIHPGTVSQIKRGILWGWCLKEHSRDAGKYHPTRASRFPRQQH